MRYSQTDTLSARMGCIYGNGTLMHSCPTCEPEAYEGLSAPSIVHIMDHEQRQQLFSLDVTNAFSASSIDCECFQGSDPHGED